MPDAALTHHEGTAGGEADAALLARSAAGDDDAFALLVGRHQASVHRFVRGLVPDADDAEDVLQEAFVAAWRGAAGYRGGGTVRSWLLSIARNAARHHARRRAGEPATVESLDALPFDAMPLDTVAIDAGWGREPAGESPLADARELLDRALARLEPGDRLVLVLRELEGLSGEETAHVLGLTLPAMKSRLHRARLRLVAALREVRHAVA